MIDKADEKIVNVKEFSDSLEEPADIKLLQNLVEQGRIACIRINGESMVNKLEALTILLKEKKLSEMKHKIIPGDLFSNDLQQVLEKGKPEELLAFAKFIRLKKFESRMLTLDMLADKDIRMRISWKLTERFLDLGSYIFHSKEREKNKIYRNILYACARRLKVIPVNKDADVYDGIPKPYPSIIDSNKKAPQKLVPFDALPTAFLESRISEGIFKEIWDKIKPEDREAYITTVIEEIKSSDAIPETEKALISSKLRNAGELSKVAGSTLPLILLSIGQASGFGIYLLATSAVGALSGALGIALPFAFYTGLTSGIAVLLGPVGFSVAALLALSAVLKTTWGPNYKLLYPAICVITRIRNRPIEQD